MDRVVFITQEIVAGSEATNEGHLLRNVTSQIIRCSMASTVKPIHIFIDTIGGDIKTALTLHDIIRASGAPIHTYAMSEVSSAGVMLFLSGDKRFAFPHTQFMTHPANLSAHGPAKDFANVSKTVSVYIEKSEEITKKRSKMSTSLYNKYHACINYIWPKEAKKAGIVTDIIEKLPEDLLGPKQEPETQEAIENLQNALDILGRLHA